MAALNCLHKISFQQNGNEIRDMVSGLADKVDLITIIIYFIDSFVITPFDFNKIELAIQLLYDNNNKVFNEKLLVALSICEQLYEGKPGNLRLLIFINEFLKMELIDHKELAQALELQTLEELKILPKMRTSKQFIRFNTNRLYKQTNYNLMRENIYGYVTITSFLFNAFQARLNPQYIDQRLLQLIAIESVDQKLILDFILNCFCFEVEDKYDYYLDFIRHSYWYCNKSKVFDEPGEKGEILLSNVVYLKLELASPPILERLYHVTALLIKYKLIRLDLIFPHLYPNDETFEKLYRKHIDTLKKEKLALSQNSLDESVELKEENKKVNLLRALLSIGALKTFEPILYKNPELLGYDRKCAMLLCRLINYMLEPEIQFFSKSFKPEEVQGLAKPQTRLTSHKQQKSLKALNLGPNKVFYYSGWNDMVIPTIQTQEHYNMLLKWLRILGHNLIDPLLYSKLAGMARDPISKDESSHKNFYVEVLRRNLLPSLSCSNANEGIQNVLWYTLTGLSSTDRFMYYGDWFRSDWYVTIELEARRFAANRRTDSVVKRITSADSRDFGLLLKKDFYCEPYVVFKRIAKEVMKFGRIPEFVEAFKFLHLLSSDIFQFFLFSVLTEPKKNGALSSSRLKDDLVNPRDWIKNLAGFVSALCRKYSQFSIAGIINYVVNQLHTGNGFDLVILTEFIITLGGICEFDNIDSDTLNGSVALRAHYFSLNLAYRATPASAGRLSDALRKSKLLPLLMIQLCKQHQDLVYLIEVNPDIEENSITDTTIPGLDASVTKKTYNEFRSSSVKQAHLDDIQSTILQLCELIANNSEDNRKRYIPTLVEFANIYQVDLPYVFNFLRNDLTLTVNEELKSKRDILNKTDMIYDDITNLPVANNDIQLISLEKITRGIESVYNLSTLQILKPEFLATFWQLHGSDLYVPDKEYTKVISYLREKRDDHKTKRPESDVYEFKKRTLEKDQSEQKKRVELTLSRLRYFQSNWFESTASHTEVAKELINHCILQRLSFSGADAVYCAKFIFTLATLNIFNYSLIDIIAYFLDNAYLLLYSSTRNEANNYGNFIEEVLLVLNRWFVNQETYQSEVVNVSPEMFSQAVLSPFLLNESDPTRFFTEHTDTTTTVLNHMGYRTLLGNLHDMFYEQIINSLQSEDPFGIINTIAFLTKVGTYFPLKRSHHQGISDIIEQFIKDDFLVSLCTSFKLKLVLNRKKFLDLVSTSKFDEDINYILKSDIDSPLPTGQSQRQSPNLNPSSSSAKASKADTNRLKQALVTPTHTNERQTTASSSDRPCESSNMEENLSETSKRLAPSNITESRSRTRANDSRDTPRALEVNRASTGQRYPETSLVNNRSNRRTQVLDRSNRNEPVYATGSRSDVNNEVNYTRTERNERYNDNSDSYRPGYSNQASYGRDTRLLPNQQFVGTRHNNFDTRDGRDPRSDNRVYPAPKRHHDALNNFAEELPYHNLDNSPPPDRRVRQRIEDNQRLTPSQQSNPSYRNSNEGPRYNENWNLQQMQTQQSQRTLQQRGNQRLPLRQSQPQNFRHGNRGPNQQNQNQGFNRNQRN